MLTQSRLKKVLSYDPNTGLFTWLVNNGNTKTGDVAEANTTKGHVTIIVDSKRYYAHQLAWLYVRGYFPEHDIGHRNGIHDDNRFSNLHEVARKCRMLSCKMFFHEPGFQGARV